MNTTGLVRKVDELGRVVIPIELRHALGIDVRDALEVLIENERVVLRKCQSTGNGVEGEPKSER